MILSAQNKVHEVRCSVWADYSELSTEYNDLQARCYNATRGNPSAINE